MGPPMIRNQLFSIGWAITRTQEKKLLEESDFALNVEIFQ